MWQGGLRALRARVSHSCEQAVEQIHTAAALGYGAEPPKTGLQLATESLKTGGPPARRAQHNRAGVPSPSPVRETDPSNEG